MPVTIAFFPLVALAIIFVYVRRKEKVSVGIRKSQFREQMNHLRAIAFYDVHVYKEITSGLKGYPYGHEQCDLFLFPTCLVMLYDEDFVGLPRFSIMIFAKDATVMSHLSGERIVPVSVSFRESARGVKIVQVKAFEARHRHRKFDVSFYNLTEEQLKALHVLETWHLPQSRSHF